MAPLKPSKLTDRFKYVFLDTECAQDLAKHDWSFAHIPNLICAQQMCFKSEAVYDLNVDCKQWGKRTHVFWAEDPVGDFLLSPAVQTIRRQNLSFHITLVDTTHSFCYKSFWNLDWHHNLCWRVLKFLIWLLRICTFWILSIFCPWV